MFSSENAKRQETQLPRGSAVACANTIGNQQSSALILDSNLLLSQADSSSIPFDLSAKVKSSAYLSSKRVFDFIFSSVLLLALFPLLILIAIAIKCSSKGPIFFRQRRLSRGGREFYMLKFRTMHAEAEQASGPCFAEPQDPRATSVGRLLRLSHLDELPQLLNVIRGEMSLIGPRPERPEISEILEKQLPNFRQRLSVRAGITGLAQVNSGYADDLESYQQKLYWDLIYVQQCCWHLDLQIALKTIRVLLTARGAR